MKFVVTGGGTGGHIYPALAIAKGLQDAFQAKVYYIGGTKGIEASIVPKAGWPFRAIQLEGFQRKISWHNMVVAWYALAGLWQAVKWIREIKPAAVVGTGGYVCGPVVLAARLCGVPTLIHEQNAFPGFTNRVLSGLTKQVALTFPESAQHFSRHARTKVTGLPVRQEILQADRETSRFKLGLGIDDLLVLSFGGSQGASSINRAMGEVCRRVMAQGDNKKLHIMHVTGPRQYETFLKSLETNGISLSEQGNITIIPYLDDMPTALAASDLAVCRAGAATLAELTVVGLPAILVPYPYAAGNHQAYNARSLEKAGAALVIEDKALQGENLWKTMVQLFSEQGKLREMAAASKMAGRPKAAEDIVHCVRSILQDAPA